MMHICVSKLAIIGWDNGLSPSWHQAIISTNTGISLIWTLGINFSEVLSEVHTFSCKKMHLNMSSAKWWPFCLGLSMTVSWPEAWFFRCQCKNISAFIVFKMLKECLLFKMSKCWTYFSLFIKLNSLESNLCQAIIAVNLHHSFQAKEMKKTDSKNIWCSVLSRISELIWCI